MRQLKCTTCKKYKDETEYYISRTLTRGRAYRCKSCCKAYQKAWLKRPNSKRLLRKYAKKHKEKYGDNEEYKKKRKRYFDRYKEKFPQKMQARWKLQDRVRRGVVERGNCEICGGPNAEGHHEDYSKPLQVRWLCRRHHAQVDSGQIQI